MGQQAEGSQLSTDSVQNCLFQTRLVWAVEGEGRQVSHGKQSPDFQAHDRDKPFTNIPSDGFLLPRRTCLKPTEHHAYAARLENNQLNAK